MAADDAKPRRAGGGLRGVIITAVGTVRTRLELLVVEVQEEEHRLASLLFNLVLSALFVGFGIMTLVLLVTVALWDSHRLLALGVGSAVLLGGGLLTGATAARLARQGSHLFAASLAELHRDHDELGRRP